MEKKAMLQLFLTVCLIIVAAAAQAGTVKIPVHYRNPIDVLSTIQSMLSPTGEAVADSLTSSVIVTDTPETIQRIRKLMPKIDVLGRQVKIRVRFREVSSAKASSLSAAGSLGDDDLEVSRGRRHKRGIAINLDERNRTKERTSESFLTVVSGGTGYIATGKDVPYREHWLLLSRRYAQLAETVVFRRVETGFEVSPMVTDDTAHIDITPRISYISTDDQEGTIRFTSARTSVIVPVGQWILIGGTASKDNEVLHAILEHGRGKTGTSLAIELMVEG